LLQRWQLGCCRWRVAVCAPIVRAASDAVQACQYDVYRHRPADSAAATLPSPHTRDTLDLNRRLPGPGIAIHGRRAVQKREVHPLVSAAAAWHQEAALGGRITAFAAPNTDCGARHKAFRSVSRCNLLSTLQWLGQRQPVLCDSISPLPVYLLFWQPVEPDVWRQHLLRQAGLRGPLGLAPSRLRQRIHLHLQDPRQRLPLQPAARTHATAALAPLAAHSTNEGQL
jgi:hypothetical protein